MSAMGDYFESILHRIEAAGRALIGHADTEVHAAGEEVVQAVAELRADAPKIEAEAAADAGQVVHDAATEGVTPAAHEAETDAVHLAEDAAHDVEAAVEGGPKTDQPQPAAAAEAAAAPAAPETPAEPTAPAASA